MHARFSEGLVMLEHATLLIRSACGGGVHDDLSVHTPEEAGGCLCSRAYM